jgi:RNA 2',3'-cyclic 3'-phosphodiesterase
MFFSPFAVRNMYEQISLPGFERHSAIDFLFFALLLGDENLPQIVQLRDRLCDENGLRGQRIAPELLHITLHGIGGYDGLPRAVVERAKQAGAAIWARPFDVILDRAMSFERKGEGRPFVLRTGNEIALIAFHRLLGGAMKNAGFRRVASQFRPHLTLLYGDRVVRERSVEAVRWTVRDFVLVQSLRGRGQSKYVHLARWPLRD